MSSQMLIEVGFIILAKMQTANNVTNLIDTSANEDSQKLETESWNRILSGRISPMEDGELWGLAFVSNRKVTELSSGYPMPSGKHVHHYAQNSAHRRRSAKQFPAAIQDARIVVTKMLELNKDSREFNVRVKVKNWSPPEPCIQRIPVYNWIVRKGRRHAFCLVSRHSWFLALINELLMHTATILKHKICARPRYAPHPDGVLLSFLIVSFESASCRCCC